ACDEAHARRYFRLCHHSGTRIHTRDVPRIADESRRLARDEPGAYSNVDDAHPLPQARAPQCMASIPGAGAEGQGTFNAVIIGRGTVKKSADKAAPLRLARVIFFKRRTG